MCKYEKYLYEYIALKMTSWNENMELSVVNLKFLFNIKYYLTNAKNKLSQIKPRTKNSDGI